MVKHTQTIHRQQPMNCLSVFNQFVGLAPKGLSESKQINQLLLPLKSSGNHRFSDDFRVELTSVNSPKFA